MSVQSFCTPRMGLSLLFIAFSSIHSASGFTGTTYRLDAEYSGNNFFDGWDFFTGGDPTGGFVTYYSRAAAQLTGLISAYDNSPAYIGSDSFTYIGSTELAGRPSVRISTKKLWTHGLFIADIAHAPSGSCGSWPAFWTLGPNWPYTGEIDIMEGVNMNNHNGMTLHTSPVCTIAGDDRLMSGQLQTSDCAYYPGYNVGCSISDNRTTSFGSDFNTNQGGVYAMQWTSESIRVWFFPRGRIPSDILFKSANPNPGTWGLPQAHFQGECNIDDHFQSHKLIINNAFCGEYAGAPSVWDSSENSCADYTGFPTCSEYVAKNAGGSNNAFWSINSIQVYQLIDPDASPTEIPTPYIASLEPTQTTNLPVQDATGVATAPLCPTYNSTVIYSDTVTNLAYEIQCGVNPAGSDLGEPYPGSSVRSFEDCVSGCSYWNHVISPNSCGGVAFNVAINACYWKKAIGSTPQEPGFNGARLIYYAYPLPTSNLTATAAISSEIFVPTVVIPQTWRDAFAPTTTSISLISETPLNSFTEGVGHGITTSLTSSTSTLTTTTSFGSSSTSSRMTTLLSSSLATTSDSSTSSSSLTSTPSLSSTLSMSTSSGSESSTTTGTTTASISVSSVVQSSISTSSSTTTTSSTTTPSTSTATPSTTSLTEPSTTSHATATDIPTFSSTPSISTPMYVIPKPLTTTTTSSSQSLSTPSEQSTTGVQVSSSTTEQTSLVSSSIASPGSQLPDSSSSPTSTGPLSSTEGSSTSSLSTEMSSTTTTSYFEGQSTATVANGTTSGTTSGDIPPSTTGASSVLPTSTVDAPTSASSSMSEDPMASTISSIMASSELFNTLTSTTSASSPGQSSTQSDPASSGMDTLTTNVPSSSSVFIVTTSVTTTTESATTTVALSVPSIVADYSYSGCLGPRPDTAFARSFTVFDTSPLMSIDRCVGICDSRSAQYAAIYDTLCLCSSYDQTVLESDYVRYQDSACDTPCPGNPTQRCGGVTIIPSESPSISLVPRKVRRQVGGGNGEEQILLIVYNNTIFDTDPGSSSSSSISPSTGINPGATTGTFTDGPIIGTTLTSSSSVAISFETTSNTLTTSSSPTQTTLSNTSVSQIVNPTIPTATTNSISTSFGISSSSLSSGIVNNPTPTATSQSITLHPTMITTSWTTICPVHPSICPTPTPTYLTTTITLLHCGCTELPTPSVPMTTTVVPCGHGCQGGENEGEHEGDGWDGLTTVYGRPAGQVGSHYNPENGATTLTTLTIPCTTEIQALQESVDAWHAAVTSVPSAGAGEQPIAQTSPGASENDLHSAQTHVDTETATLTLVPARPDSAYNASMPTSLAGGNVTWTPAGVTPHTLATEAPSGAAGNGDAGADATQFRSSAPSMRTGRARPVLGDVVLGGLVCVLVLCSGLLS